VDERQEQRAVEPVLVEIVRRHVGRRDQHHAVLEQPSKQTAENHGVGDVGDVEFVEAQQPGLIGDLVGDVADRIAVADLAELQLMSHLAHALVHVGHELVEVRPPLAPHLARGKEEIHEHGLAAADVAENIEALDRTGRLVP